MTYSSQYYMPGAFFDSQGSGVHPSVFRPPVSPSASSSVHLGKSTVSVQSEVTTPAAHAKRKRTYTHNGPSQQQQQQPASRGPANPDHFPLAGQLETPGGFQGDGESTVLEESLYSDYDFRRALGSKPSQTAAESPACGQPTQLIRPVEPPAGWSRVAFNTLGGVVGKVWEFCTASAFKGFYAGGGTGYSIEDPASTDLSNGAATDNSPRDYFSSRTAGDSTPVPGDFPQADYIPDGGNTTGTTTPDATPSRPTKRRQISGADDILKNWVVVDELNSGEKSRPSSRVSSRTPGRATPSRNTRPSVTTGRRISVPVSRINTTPGPNRRSSYRASHASSPAPSSHEPASFAGMRSFRPVSPPPPSPSPSRIPIPVSASREHYNPYTSPRPSSAASGYRTSVGGVMSPTSRTGGHRRTHSGASAASGRAPREDETALSPRLTEEARRLAAKRRREEKDNDMRMNDFNSRLQAMIRQGKEALGTKIEVEGEGAGGGWESDE